MQSGVDKVQVRPSPEESTLDAEATPEITIAATCNPSTEEKTPAVKEQSKHKRKEAANSKDFQHLNKDEAGHIYGDTPSGTEKHRGADGKSTPINRQLGQPPCSML
ncbi:hypothetical protein YC2023_087730 [Brassica napus]